MMRLLVLLSMTIVKCNGRSLLELHQTLNSDVQQKSIAKLEGAHMQTDTITTTLDPWDEFCKEACGQGLAGPECDCPEHLYLKKNVHSPKQSILMKSDPVSVSTTPKTTTLDPWDEFCKEACEEGLAGPECDCPKHFKTNMNMVNNKLSFLTNSYDVSSSSPTRTTTLDPWEEFCKEACEEGLAGPECDCPEHFKTNENINNGKLSFLTNSDDESSNTPTRTTTLDPWEEFCKEACEEGFAGPECDCPEHLNSKKSVPSNELLSLLRSIIMSVRSSTSTTTLDPWDEFCKEACEEGQAGPECDCPDHPIG